MLQSLPDAAYFGEKDYQQLLVVRGSSANPRLRVQIHGDADHARGADGLGPVVAHNRLPVA